MAALAAHVATPMGTLMYRAGMAFAMAAVAACVGTFTLGLKSRANTIITWSATSATRART